MMDSQLPLPFKLARGGARPGAGRPRVGRTRVPHRARPRHKARLPLHVTVRARGGLPPFRRVEVARAIGRVIATASRDAFRILHFSIQANHLHLIVEAHDEVALARGMQWLNARAAKAINAFARTQGRVWRERYHARELTTPRAVRKALVYVLMNARKHGLALATGIDVFSSAPWFDGFAGYAPTTNPGFIRAPRTWLARVGWRRRGLLGLDERPRAPS